MNRSHRLNAEVPSVPARRARAASPSYWIRRVGSLVAVMAFWLGLVAPAVAQFALNDNFANATPLTRAGAFVGNNSFATTEVFEPATYQFGTGTRSVWFQWTAPSSGFFTFDTGGSVFDTTMGVFTGPALQFLTRIVDNDDAQGFPSLGLDSRVTFFGNLGTTYYIAVNSLSRGGSSGNYVLNVPVAGLGSGGSGGLTNDSFSGAEVISGPSGTVSGTTFGASKEVGEPNHGGNPGGASIWYSWTAPVSGGVSFDTLGANFNTLLGVYTGTDVTNLTTVASDDNSGPNGSSRVRFTAVAGTNYFIAVDAFNGLAGSSILNWGYESAAGQFRFTSTNYYARVDQSSVNDNGADPLGAEITVTRVNGSTGRMLVDYQVLPGGSGTAGVDYPAFATNGTLVFDDFQMSAKFVLPLFTNFTVFGFTNTVVFGLTNARPDVAAGEDPTLLPALTGPLTTTLTIEDPNSQFFNNNNFRIAWFLRGNYRVGEGTTALIRTSGAIVGYRVISVPGAGFFGASFVGRGGFAVQQSLLLQAGSDYARANDVPLLTTNRIGSVFYLQIPDDTEVEFNEDTVIWLVSPTGFVEDEVTLTVLFDDQPPGAMDRTYNLDGVATTIPPFNSAPGANGPVYAVAVDAAGQALIAGNFTAVNAQFRRCIARMDTNGAVDFTFTPGVGADDFISAIGVYTGTTTNVGTIVIGGAFTSFNGTGRNHIARLLPNGLVDPFFNPGFGADAPVRAMAFYTNGTHLDKVIIVGDFTSFNGTNRNHIARLNADGSLDSSFNPGTGANGNVFAVKIQSDGKVVIGGDFTTVNDVPRNRIARVNAAGALDLSFNPGAGADGNVYALALDDGATIIPNGVVVNATANRTAAGGANEDIFDFVVPVPPGTPAGTPISGIVTINYDFYSIPDSLNVYLGTNHLGVSNVPPATLLFATGLVPGSQTLTISFGPSTNSIVRIIMNQGNNANTGTAWTYDATLTAVISSTPQPVPAGPQKILLGGAFTSVDQRGRNSIARLNPDGTVDTTFDPGRGFDGPVFALVQEPGRPLVAGGLFTSFNSTRRMGLAQLRGDGTLDTGFMDTAYNQFAGLPIVISTEPKKFIDTIAFQPDGNLIVGGSFARVGGGFRRDEVHPRSNFTRIIGGSINGPGNIGFAQSTYNFDENGGSSFITLTRTNGSLGQAAATFSTEDRPAGPGAAQAGADYTSLVSTPTWVSTFGIIAGSMLSEAFQGPNNATFASGVATNGFVNGVFINIVTNVFVLLTNTSVVVTLRDDVIIEGDEVFNLTLSQPNGKDVLFLGGENIPLGVALGPSSARLTIIDNDFQNGVLGFASSTFTVNENAGVATITVLRTNGTVGSVSVDYATTNGTALAGFDYVATRGTLTFGGGVTSRTFTVPIVDDTIAESDETILLSLSNPVGGATLNSGVLPSFATLVIYDNDFAPGKLTFVFDTVTVTESVGSAVFPVIRTGGSVGTITVDYYTTNDTALAGSDYVATAGTLTWVSGDTAPKNITVPIINDSVPEGTEFFNVVLNNPRVVATGLPGMLGLTTNVKVTILDDDFAGAVEFTSAIYNANENGGSTVLTVRRTGGVSGQALVDYAVTGGTASPGTHFNLANGTLVIEDGLFSGNFTVQLIDNLTPDGNQTVVIDLSNPQGAVLGATTRATLTIIDDESFNVPAGSVDTEFNAAAGGDNFVYSTVLQPDQKVIVGGDFRYFNGVARNRIARIDTDGNLDPTFDPQGGVNGSVRSLALQPDGKVLVAGLFSVVNGTNRARVARLNPDGSLDATFNPGSGPDNPAYTLALQADGRVLVGGLFTSVGGQPRNFIARLGTNGVVDPSFNPGVGPNGNVYAIAVQADGQIVIGGDFTTVAGVSRGHVARLNPNGSVDPTFSIPVGANDSVRSILIQPDGRIVVGGLFTTLNGAPRAFVGRLNADGTLDNTFNPGEGGSHSVYAMALQDDGKLVLGGDFNRFGGVGRNRIVRLNSDGSVDPAVNFGAGANSFVATITVYTSGPPIGKILIGGGFTSYDGLPRNYLARINGGDNGGQGRLEFVSATFSVTEETPEALISVRRIGGTADAVTVDYATVGGTATPYLGAGPTAGFDYTNTTGTLTFPPGETFRTFRIGIINDALAEPDETIGLMLSNPAGPPFSPASLAVALGNQPTATLTIVDDESVFNFGSASYSVVENTVSGTVILTVNRTGGAYKTASVKVVTRDGTATAGLDFVSLGTNTTLSFGPGETTKTIAVQILNDSLVEGDETFFVDLLDQTGVAALLGTITTTQVTIVDDDLLPGTLSFASGTFVTNENAGVAIITVVRTNGSTGIISVQFATSDGSATAGLDYLATNGILSFADGEVSKSFAVPVILDSISEPTETVNLILSNPTGGALLGAQSRARLQIINNDFVIYGNVVFSSPVYSVTENAGAASVSVLRAGGTATNISVVVSTADGTGVAGRHYLGITNTLTWGVGDNTPRTFSVTIIDNQLVDGNKTVNLVLSNPGGGASVGLPGQAVLTILDDDTAPGVVGFATATYTVIENFGGKAVTLIRTNGFTGVVSVDFATLDGTAVAGVDYTGVTNTVVFQNGQTNRTVFVPVIDNQLQEGNRTLALILFNPTNTTLARTNASLTIFDNERAAGSADIGFLPGAGANNTVYGVAYRDSDGTLVAAGDFTMFNTLPRTNVVRLLPDGQVDSTFDPGAIGSLGNNGVSSVRAVALYTNGIHVGKVVIAGFFDSVGGLGRTNIARLNVDGTPDTNFLASAVGVANGVYAVAVQNDGRVLIGGGFTLVNGVARNFIARLNDDGTVDSGFDPGSGANATVRSIAIDENGQILIAGDFTVVDGVLRNRIARLKADGTVDKVFDPRGGADGTVNTVVVTPDGHVVIGGAFGMVNGVPRIRLARLDDVGLLDASFDPGTGPDEQVSAVAIEPDGSVLAGGAFTTVGGQTRNRFVRLTPAGVVDSTINIGTGANNFVAAVLRQPDNKIVLGGGFTAFNEVPTFYLTRLNGGKNSGRGNFNFLLPSYTIAEDGTNQVVTVIRAGGLAGAVSVNYTTVDGTGRAGFDFTATAGTLTFPDGVGLQTFSVPILDNLIVDGARDFTVTLLAPSVGSTLGAAVVTTITVLDNDGVVGFNPFAYSINENGGAATISVRRAGGSSGTVRVDFTTFGGSAVAGTHYTPTNGTLTFLPGQTAATFTVRVFDDNLVNGDRNVVMILSNLVGSATFGRTNALLTILDNEFAPGTIRFGTNFMAVHEALTNVTVTILRTNGSSGIVSVGLVSADWTAFSPGDFRPLNTIVTFQDGETVKTVDIPIVADGLSEPDEFFTVSFVNPTGGLVLAETNAVVAILDASLRFETNNFVFNEGLRQAVITVLRPESTRGPISVDYLISPGGATFGDDYLGTNGTLLFLDGESNKTFTITLVDNLFFTPNKTVFLQLTNATPGVVLTLPSAVLTITDNDPFAVQTRFVNPAPITIRDNTNATPYPSTLLVSGVNGQVVRVQVTLSNLTHTVPADIDMLLVGPGGQKVMLLSDAGGNFAVSGVNLQFDDFATNSLPDAAAISNGLYKPTNYGTVDNMLAPAPAGPYGSVLATFNAINPNGLWSLYVMDDQAQGAGVVADGWGLLISTIAPPATNDLVLTIHDIGDPAVVNGSISYTIAIVNNGPADATGVVLYDPLPAQMSFISAVKSQGSVSNAFGTIVYNVGTISNGASASLTIVVAATIPGVFTNTVFVVAAETDRNLADNYASETTTVGIPVSSGAGIIDNGTVQLGINPAGHLNVPGGPPSSGTGTTVVGLRYLPTGAESTAPGCACEGWGVADGIRRISGYADETLNPRVVNFVVESFTSDGRSAVSVVLMSNIFRVTHNYHPSVTSNLYEVGVTIENISTNAAQVLYRRVMDWDIEPTAFREYSTIIKGTSTNLIFTSDNGFASPDPLFPGGSILATGTFIDSGPADHGALFDFDFGLLQPGASTSFKTYYGAAGSEVAALNAIGRIGAEAYSFGQPSTVNGATLGTPNTFIFAFGGIGGSALAGTDVGVSVVAGPNPALLGDVVTYTMTVTNAGPDAATGIVLTDVLPADVSFGGVNTTQGSISNSPGAFTVNLGNLAVGGIATVTFSVRPNSVGALTNVVSIVANEPDPRSANDSATNVIPVVSVGTFGNSAPIPIADAGTALTYPATINVTGLTGTVSHITVSLLDLSHTFPADLDILLVAPDGRALMLMSDAGQGFDLSNAFLVFDDNATNSLPSNAPILSGNYQPTDINLGGPDFFPPPAPAGPYTNATLATFNGMNPNGAWKLFIVDDQGSDTGQLAGGWRITFQTFTPAPPSPPVRTVRSGNNLTVSWPLSAAGFVLESSPSLSPPNWQPVLTPPANDGVNFSVTVVTVSGTGYFRLRKP